MQASITCVLGMVTCHLNMAISIWRPEWLKDHKVGMFRWRKVIRKGLKRARRLLSGIRRLQSNTIFRWMETSPRYSIACVDQQPNNMQGLSVRCNNACTNLYSNWAPQCERSLFQRKWHFDDILKQYWTTQMSNSRYITSMEMQDLNTNLVCHVTAWLYTVNPTVNLQVLLKLLIRFETILMHAERLGYEI